MSVRFVLVALVAFEVLAVVAGAQAQVGRSVWRFEGDQGGAGLGSAVAAAGDVNGDGYGDVLVGAYAYDGDLDNEGLAAVFHGSPEGPSKLPDWTAEGDISFANFGEALAGAGDVNGDGYDDVIVGAWQARRAHVFHGSAAGLAASPSFTALTGDYGLGWSVAGAGDVNGDGYDDVLVGTLHYANGQENEGRVYAYLGSAAGLAGPVWAVEGNQANAHFGAALARAGDVNGDGYGDVLVDAPLWNNGQNDEGRAFLFLGSAAGLATSPAWTAEGDQAGVRLGATLATAGDVNGDGYDDVILMAGTYSNGESSEGAAFVYLGSPAGLAASPAWSTESNQFSALGGGVSSGDLDGDGYGDVLVGYYAYDRDQRDEGRVFAFFGSPAGLATNPGWSAEGNQRNSSYGATLAGAGDVDGDGYGDVLVGAFDFDGGQRNEGRVSAYLGSPRRRLP
ncbi:MAG TPA: FG-GAP-like repeat-containing protein [Planctomycetota bacterium]